MASKLSEIVIDCADPAAQARFWCAALDYQVLEEEDGFISVGVPGTPTLGFALVPEGKTVKNRLHLDLRPTDREQDAEVERLLALGARRVDVGQGDDVTWICLADPEGNEFCVL